MSAARRWSVSLQEWAIPKEIIDAAPEPPWGFPVALFVDNARRALSKGLTPTHKRAAEALPPGGAVLDVGAGAGAASIPLVPPAKLVIAVDQDPKMLQALQQLAAGRADVCLVEGPWPAVKDEAGVADVVVCAHVLYNVADLGPFLEALTLAASRRVVVEISQEHPQSPLSPLWGHFWGLSRPAKPTAADAADVVREVLGTAPSVERWERPGSFLAASGSERVAWVRRRLCLPAEADDELAHVLAGLPGSPLTEMVTMWWPGGPTGISRARAL